MNTPKFFRNGLCAATLLTLAALFSATVFADGQTAQTNSPPPKAENKPAGPTFSPEQKEALRNIMKGTQENMRSAKSFHDELQALAESDEYTEAKARALIQKHQKEAEEHMVASSRDMHKFYQSLSPEQKKQMEAIRNNMKERMKERTGQRPETRDKK